MTLLACNLLYNYKKISSETNCDPYMIDTRFKFVWKKVKNTTMTTKSAPGEKLWGGCFSENVDRDLDKLNSSIDVDKRMYAEDIEGSIAYSRALVKAKLLSPDEGMLIIENLKKVKLEWDEGIFTICEGDEDIHTAVERRLTELIGNIAGKLHTGRSRNDQTVTDTRLWLRKAIHEILATLVHVIERFVTRAECEKQVILPGYTHLQRAQPVRWSHWLLSHAWNLKSDYKRLIQIRERVDVMPLGSGALAGNPFHIDRVELANELEFSGGASDNSMQAVSDRDFVAEYLFWSSLTSVHLSRLAEDLIIYSAQEFNFVKLSDAFSTGSSLMPQKRNPDCMELVRGKTGTVLGKFLGFMVTLKGIPSTYNKDLQEDKEALFTTHDILIKMLNVTEGAIRTLKIEKKNCQSALEYNMLATDVAYYLVRKGIPFREAHHIAGKVVAFADSKKIHLEQITLDELQLISRAFDADIADIWDFEKSVEQYNVLGGTSSAAVQRQIDDLRNWLKTLAN